MEQRGGLGKVSLWNSRYLPRKVSLSETMMEAPRLSRRSVLEKVPLLAYSDNNLSAKKVVNLASPDWRAQAMADPMLLLWSAFIPITLQVLVTTECRPLSAAIDTTWRETKN